MSNTVELSDTGSLSIYDPGQRYPWAKGTEILFDSSVFDPGDEWGDPFSELYNHCLKTGSFQNAVLIAQGASTFSHESAVAQHEAGPTHIIGTDITDSAVSAIERGIETTQKRAPHVKMIAIKSDGLQNPKLKPYFGRATHQSGCMPQLPMPPKHLITMDDPLSHYYDPTGLSRNETGHGLMNRILEETQENIPNRPIGLWNMAERFSPETIRAFFADHAYNAKPVGDGIIVQQHAESSLHGLFDGEAQGHKSAYYLDREGTKEIPTLHEAEKLRLAGTPTFHRVRGWIATPI